jgi:hypothetical protein
VRSITYLSVVCKLMHISTFRRAFYVVSNDGRPR